MEEQAVPSRCKCGAATAYYLAVEAYPEYRAGQRELEALTGNIHSGADTIDHVNYDFAMEILRMNVAFVAGRVGLAS